MVSNRMCKYECASYLHAYVLSISVLWLTCLCNSYVCHDSFNRILRVCIHPCAMTHSYLAFVRVHDSFNRMLRFCKVPPPPTLQWHQSPAHCEAASHEHLPSSLSLERASSSLFHGHYPSSDTSVQSGESAATSRTPETSWTPETSSDEPGLAARSCATHNSTLQRSPLQRTATHCNTLQHISDEPGMAARSSATHCSTLFDFSCFYYWKQ